MLKKELELENKDLKKRLEEWENWEHTDIFEMSRKGDALMNELQDAYREAAELRRKYYILFGAAMLFMGISLVFLAFLLSYIN